MCVIPEQTSPTKADHEHAPRAPAAVSESRSHKRALTAKVTHMIGSALSHWPPYGVDILAISIYRVRRPALTAHSSPLAVCRGSWARTAWMAAAWQAYDAWVSRQVFRGLDAVGLHKPGALASPLTRDLPLIASPTPQVTAVVCYLAVVLLGVARLKALGPSARPLP